MIPATADVVLPVATLKSTKSSPRIVHHALDVKGWLTTPPTVESARPGSCVVCDAPSRPTGGGLGLHGHGLRDRQLRGPPSVDEAPAWIVIACRRYLCTSCDTVITVVPRGVAPRRHYGHAAIAMALALWAVVGATVAEIRERVCAWRLSDESAARWPTLRRWARAARTALDDASLTLGTAAARAAQHTMGHAPPSLRCAAPEAQAFAGGSAMS